MEIGTDINRSWTFQDGDLLIVSDLDNLKQAIPNRLSCIDGLFDNFYLEYGSVLSSYFGFRKDQITLEFMKIELERVLLQDPRIRDFELEVEFDTNNTNAINVKLRINLNGAIEELNFITDGITVINNEEIE